jgi:hypothetical protein
LLPIVRVTLTDGAKLEAAVARIETAAGAAAPVAMIGAQRYRYRREAEDRDRNRPARGPEGVHTANDPGEPGRAAPGGG